MATMAVVQMTERNDNGGGSVDEHAMGLLAVPHPLARWQSEQQRE
jgi:hypothetical protein